MQMQSVLLIHPPLVKPSEPPAGLARLAGALKRHDVACTVVDANLEGLLYLMNRRAFGAGRDTGDIDDTWTKRACRQLDAHLRLLRNRKGYISTDSYKRAVQDINRVLGKSVPADAVRLSLSDYEDRRRSPVRSPDLIAAARMPADNPFFGYFKARFPALPEKEQPSWIGFSLNYLSQALCCFAMIGFMREIFPAAKIVLGGGLVTSWMHRPDWRNPFKGLLRRITASFLYRIICHRSSSFPTAPPQAVTGGDAPSVRRRPKPMLTDRFRMTRSSASSRNGMFCMIRGRQPGRH
jgi:hypothetical protein